MWILGLKGLIIHIDIFHIYIDSFINVHAYINVGFKGVPSTVVLRNNVFNKVY